jgi:uncharacterized protein (TIGR00369 family)
MEVKSMNPESLFWKVANGELPRPNAAALLGWKFITYDEQNSKAYIEFDASAELTNPMGNIQGGILSAMLDDCMGPSVYANLSATQVAVTIEAKTQFFRPASPGRILGWGQVEHATSKICFTTGQLTNEAHEVLARATAIYQIHNLR